MEKDILKHPDIYHCIRYKSRNFLRIYFQNSTSGKYFANKEEAKLFKNEEISYKFSIIELIDVLPRYDKSYFEFLLFYPTIDYTVHWKQSISPLHFNETDLETDDIGYQPIGAKSYTRFKGLMRSTCNYALLDGDIMELNFCQFAVGTNASYGKNNLIPGPCKGQEGVKDVQYVELYLRIAQQISSLYCFKTRIIQTTLLLLFIFLQYS